MPRRTEYDDEPDEDVVAAEQLHRFAYGTFDRGLFDRWQAASRQRLDPTDRQWMTLWYAHGRHPTLVAHLLARSVRVGGRFPSEVTRRVVSWGIDVVSGFRKNRVTVWAKLLCRRARKRPSWDPADRHPMHRPDPRLPSYSTCGMVKMTEDDIVDWDTARHEPEYDGLCSYCFV